MKKWSIRMQDGGPHTYYDKRTEARAAAKHRSRFDDCPYIIFKHTKCKSDGVVVSVHVETHDFHKALRAAVA